MPTKSTKKMLPSSAFKRSAVFVDRREPAKAGKERHAKRYTTVNRDRSQRNSDVLLQL